MNVEEYTILFNAMLLLWLIVNAGKEIVIILSIISIFRSIN